MSVATFDLVFPPDLVVLLRERRSVADHDRADKAAIRGRARLAARRAAFRPRAQQSVVPEWGDKPARLDACEEIFRSVVSRAPMLIPLIGHRYLPAVPCESGNPVFSVYQRRAE
ncbi:hypothetical protein ACQR1I_33130 [Bradyrhizobium sp. HKCCYLS2038]|uniref:hypothetical protein n=1 Tax=unclassified Bradyrhizobium TaxID=2631580 RepID=UPI003EC04AEE